MYGDTLDLTPYQRRKRAESAYRLHIVYGWTWREVAEGWRYKSAESARRCATRVAATALEMFYGIPQLDTYRHMKATQGLARPA